MRMRISPSPALIRQLLATIAGACVFGCAGGSAEGAVKKPLRIVVGFPAGSVNDLAARVLAPQVNGKNGARALVENRPGANGMVAAETVAHATADGNVVILGGMTTLVLNPLVYRNMRYDTLRDLVPVTTVAAIPQVIVTHPSLPATSLGDLSKLARKGYDSLAVAHPGVGSLAHLTLELFKTLSGVVIDDVPYKAAGPALREVVGGHVSVFIADVPTPLPYVKLGKLNALAVTGDSRSHLLPGVPTAREQGYPELRVTNWLGIMAPAKTPPAVVDRLHTLFVAAIVSAETRDRYRVAGMDVIHSRTPADFDDLIRQEFKRWRNVVRYSAIQLE